MSFLFFFKLSGLYDFARLAFIVYGIEHIAALRHLGQAENLNRDRRPRLLHAASLIVIHRTDTAHAGACHNNIADAQRSVLYQNGGNRAAALIQLRLNYRSLCGAVGVGFQLLHLGNQKYHFKQSIDVGSLLGRNLHTDSIAAPFLRNQTVLGQLLADAIGVGALFINLINGNNDRYLCGAGMVDGLNGLRHDTVIGRNHQDRNIGHQCTSCTHGGKRLVSRRI